MSASSVRQWLAALTPAPQGITVDSRQVEPGILFAALPGAHHDGRRFIGEAVKRGAAGVLWEQDDGTANTSAVDVAAFGAVPQCGVRDLAHHLGDIAAAVYRQPSRALRLIGVTGTNGKTSCTQWIGQALNAQGRRTALIGTLGNGFPGALEEAPNTTPDAAAVQRWLARFRDARTAAVAMEVSSIGLDAGRVDGCVFDTALFTNLTRDHLDYHGTLEAYAAAKARLFAWPELRCAVINRDDAASAVLIDNARRTGAQVLTYGSRGADVSGGAMAADAYGMCFEVTTPYGSGTVRSALAGEFNRLNLLAVLAVLLAQQVPLDDALQALQHLTPPPGRMQRLGGAGEPAVVIDYAHTPDALDNVLRALQATKRNGQRLFCVFGCGGDRDPGKRPLMGEIAGRRADCVWVTNDNPRSEAPQEILAAIESGLRGTGTPWRVEPDRAQAIAEAVAEARPGDTVLIAGKGHEPYQEIDGVRHPFLDAEVAQRALRTWRSS